MGASFEHIELKENESFFIGVFQDNLEKSTWHYHTKYELSFITEGTGKRIVGNSIEEFGPGDLIFIGMRLPHVWIPEENKYGSKYSRSLESVYLQFGEELFPDVLLNMPELHTIRKALDLARRGIQISGETLNKASELMLELPYLDGFRRIMCFYKILDEIGKSETNILLASEDYIVRKFESSNERIVKIHEYLMSHLQQKIKLSQLAEIVHMTPESLCRFFKSHMGITIIDYLNKIKVEYASSLLSNKELSISDVGFDCGFNNLSHFNKQFKRFMKITPSNYRMQLGYS